MKRNSKAIREKKSRQNDIDSFERKRRKNQKRNKHVTADRINPDIYDEYIMHYDELNTSEDV